MDTSHSEDQSSRNALGIAILIVAALVCLIWLIPGVIAFIASVFGLIVGLIAGVFSLIALFFAGIFWLIFGLMATLLFFVPFILAGGLAIIIAVALAKMLRGASD